MRKRFLLLIIFILCLCTTISFFLTLIYIDPLVNTWLAITIITFSFFTAFSTFITLLFYFIKKIYYRGDVYIFHVLTSFRQGAFISLFVIGCIAFDAFGELNGWTIFALGMLLSMIELFIQNIFYKE